MTCNCGLYKSTTAGRMSPNMVEFSGTYTAVQAKNSAGKDVVVVPVSNGFEAAKSKIARQVINIDPVPITPQEFHGADHFVNA